MPISGREMLKKAKKAKKAGWRVVGQKGSHIKVKNGDQIEIIPDHKELKKGMESHLLKRFGLK